MNCDFHFCIWAKPNPTQIIDYKSTFLMSNLIHIDNGKNNLHPISQKG